MVASGQAERPGLAVAGPIGSSYWPLGAPGASGRVTSTSKDVCALPASFEAVALTVALPPFWGSIVSVLPSVEADTTSLADDET